MTEFESNQRVADQICESFQWGGQAFSSGQFVAVLDGKVVAIESEPIVAIEKLRAIEGDSQPGMMFEVRSPVVDVIRGR